MQAYQAIFSSKNEQMVRYLGYYSNVCRGRRKKKGACESDCVIEDDGCEKGANKSWSRLIKKIYEADPLICPIWRALHMVQYVECYNMGSL